MQSFKLNKMITFGYSSKFSGFIRAAVAIALAVLMFVTPDSALAIVVKICAVMLGVAGVATTVYAIINRTNPSFPLWITNAVMDLVIAVLMFRFASFIAGIVVYVVGVVLCAVGLWETIVLTSARRNMKFNWWVFGIPSLVVVLFGVFLMIVPTSPTLKASINIFVGIALAVYAVSELMSTVKMLQVIKKVEDETAPDEQPVNEQPIDDQSAESQSVDDQSSEGEKAGK